jgi:hypothetical protein
MSSTINNSIIFLKEDKKNTYYYYRCNKTVLQIDCHEVNYQGTYTSYTVRVWTQGGWILLYSGRIESKFDESLPEKVAREAFTFFEDINE